MDMQKSILQWPITGKWWSSAQRKHRRGTVQADKPKGSSHQGWKTKEKSPT
jgi:hypothetical protein